MSRTRSHPPSPVAQARPTNRLLALLAPQDLKPLAAHLEPVELELKQLLYEHDQPIDYVYFVHRGVVSLVSAMHGR